MSGGVDADVEYATTHEEIARQGHVWVGVSAQQLGVEGGPVLVRVDGPAADVAGLGLKAMDNARYGSLAHPGDAFANDIYTQVARALREGGAALGDVVPTHLIAIGESQSAAALVTYINAVQPLTRIRWILRTQPREIGLPIAAPGETADMAGSITGTASIVRTDTDVPVFVMQTESDVTMSSGRSPPANPTPTRSGSGRSPARPRRRSYLRRAGAVPGLRP